MKQKLDKVALIMAGGTGYRLWPRVSDKNPKQFQHMLGDGTMIQNTVHRLTSYFSWEQIFIVTLPHYTRFIHEQLPGIPEANIIVEPFGRNTAPCIALSLTALQPYCSADTVFTIFPSDHIVSNVREFHHALEALETGVRRVQDSIVALGSTATRPEPLYGYMQLCEDKAGSNESQIQRMRKVQVFAEKPDVATAQRFCDSGDFLWNTGVFSATYSTLQSAIEEFLPDHAPLFQYLSRSLGTDDFVEKLENTYRQIRAVSIDRAVMEYSNNLYVVEGTFAWSDVGTWDEVYRLSMKDGKNNVIEGDVVAIDSSNCYVSSSERLIGIVDVDDVMVVDSADATLICRRGSTAKVKELVDYLRRKQINRYL